MTAAKLASKLAGFEGKKVQSSIGNIRELLKLMWDVEAQEIFDGTTDFRTLRTEELNKRVLKLKEKEAKAKARLAKKSKPAFKAPTPAKRTKKTATAEKGLMQ